MPSYRYRPLQGRCRLCGDGYEAFQSPAEAPHSECPKCGLAVERISADSVSVPKITKPMSPSAAKNAGFTILRRTSDGSWEKQ